MTQTCHRFGSCHCCE